jgi:hypothetical protein
MRSRPNVSTALACCYGNLRRCRRPSSTISPRQAYRYLQQAVQLTQPVAVSESKLAFTVKLPRSLIQRVRLYASVKRISISEVVTRALLAFLPRRGGRG